MGGLKLIKSEVVKGYYNRHQWRSEDHIGKFGKLYFSKLENQEEIDKYLII
jgi:hypothetical protein